MSLEEALADLEKLFLEKLKISANDQEGVEEREPSVFESTSSSREHRSMEVENFPMEIHPYSVFNENFEVLDSPTCKSIMERLEKMPGNPLPFNDVSSRFFKLDSY